LPWVVNGKNANKVSPRAQILTFSFETAPIFATLAILACTSQPNRAPTRQFSPQPNLPDKIVIKPVVVSLHPVHTVLALGVTANIKASQKHGAR
jgi:hypothetical protein